MSEENRAKIAWKSGPVPHVKGFGHTQQFRFIPESYLAAVGAHWDPGLDLLVYLQMFIEDEMEETAVDPVDSAQWCRSQLTTSAKVMRAAAE